MSRDEYMLDVGARAVSRLELVDRAYGPSSQGFLRRAGLREGMVVVELGCGIGTMTKWIAQQVGPQGRVIAVDADAAQLSQAQARCAGMPQVTFQRGDARQTGLAAGQADIVYARLLLMHVPKPSSVLEHMATLLKVGGVGACEELAIDSTFCEPQSLAQRRLHEIATTMAQARECDYNVARRLARHFLDSGFSALEVSAHQPVYLRGEEKRIEELSFREALPYLLKAESDKGKALAQEAQDVCDELYRLTQDDTVLYALAMMMQVYGRKAA